MSERWLPVVGFEGFYEVSDQGRVRSLDREGPQFGRAAGLGYTRLFRGRVLKPSTNTARGGYRYVNLHVDGRQCLRRVCVLVAAAFLGPRPAGHETRHLNGRAGDDRADNLAYGTPKQNAADRRVHGTHQQGETVPTARLTERDVRRIKTGRESADKLAAVLGVHPGHINNIRRGVRWAHVTNSVE